MARVCFALVGACVLASVCDAQTIRERDRFDAAFSEQLTALAAKCDEKGLAEQARITREWFVPRDPRRQYIFLPAEADPHSPDANASMLVQFWHHKFRELRRQQAESLFALAKDRLEQQQPTSCFQLLHEVLREDPDHEEARRVLGYRKVNDRWRRPTATIGARKLTQADPQSGFAAGQAWRIESEHFHVTTNLGEATGKSLARQLEDLYAVWQQVFFRYWSNEAALRQRFTSNAAPARSRDEHKVVLFRDRREYLQRLQAIEPQIEISLGVYLDRRRTAFFYQDEPSIQATWWHEATHQLFAETGTVVPDFGAKGNFWLLEGVALYMESLARHDGYVTLGGCTADRLQFARHRAFNERFYLPLAELNRLGGSELKKHADIRAIYGQAAGLTHFLMDFDRGRYQEAVVDCLRQVYQGRDNRDNRDMLATATKAGLEQLDREYQSSLNVTDGDLAFVGSVPLRNLCLSHTAVTDAGVARFAGQKEFGWIDLAHTKVGNAGLAQFQNSRKLTQLFLERSAVDEGGLETIVRFLELEELDLTSLPITDAGLEKIGRLKNLKSLWLGGTQVTDAGLKHLESLKQLAFLDVEGTQVTPDGLRRLRQKLPGLSKS